MKRKTFEPYHHFALEIKTQVAFALTEKNPNQLKERKITIFVCFDMVARVAQQFDPQFNKQQFRADCGIDQL